MTRWDSITIDPGIMNGQPCIRGMRLTVRRVVEAMAVYDSKAEVLQEYPELNEEDLLQALDYAARSLSDEVFTIDAA
ncbi:MAG: DUF433 domain-containing protein [Deferrisomatales bacterium]